MISLLSGTIIEKNTSTVILETAGGVAYEIHTTASDAAATVLQTPARFYTYLKVSDSALELFGFRSIEARDFFTLLLTVSGIGPKSALNILSLGSIDSIQSAIARGDVKYLTGVQGMGKKTAERLVVELKSKIKNLNSKISEVETTEMVGVLGDVVDGLVAMGYSNAEARSTAQLLDVAGKTSEVLLREALQSLER